MSSLAVQSLDWLQRLILGHGALVDLRFKNIRDEGAIVIGDALKQNSRLRILDLSNNNIGYAAAIAEALLTNRTLAVLDLSNNKIGPRGAQAIADALKRNKTLHVLYLSYNYIGDGGAKAIAAALKHNNKLHNLDISCNHIGDEGTNAIANSLKHNKTLQRLFLIKNSVGQEGLRTIGEALLQHNTTIIGYCPSTPETNLILHRNRLLSQKLPQQAYDLALALWPLIGGDVYTLLLVLDKFPHAVRVKQCDKVEFLQPAVEYMARKETE